MNWESISDMYTLPCVTQIAGGKLHIYPTMCYIDSQWEAAADPGELSLVLCDDLDWWVGGGGWEEGPRGKDICIHIAYV